MADVARRRLTCRLALLAAGASSARAQPAGAAALKVDQVAAGLFRLDGGGATALMRFTPAGTLLLGCKRASHQRPLLTTLQRLGRTADLAVRLAVLPSHLPEHAGNAAALAAAGVPLVAHERTLARLPDLQRGGSGRMAPRSYRDQLDVSLGERPMQLHHLGPAVTDNDSVLLFADLRLLALGDLYTAQPPLPDWVGGGSLGGWIRALDAALGLPWDRALGAAGPLVDRTAVQALRQRLQAARQRARDLGQQGLDPQAVAADLVQSGSLGQGLMDYNTAGALRGELAREQLITRD